MSCSTGENKQTIILSDDLFVVKNLKNTSLIHSFKYQNNRQFSDSTVNPNSHLVLSGGLLAGLNEANDSLTSWGEETFSKID